MEDEDAFWMNQDRAAADHHDERECLGDTLQRIKLAVKPVFRPLRSRPSPRRPHLLRKLRTAIRLIVNERRWAFVWESTDLTRRDLNIQKATTHQRNRLDKFDKGNTRPKSIIATISVMRFFKIWMEDHQGKDRDEARATFQLVIKGVDYGDFSSMNAASSCRDTATAVLNVCS